MYLVGDQLQTTSLVHGLGEQLILLSRPQRAIKGAVFRTDWFDKGLHPKRKCSYKISMKIGEIALRRSYGVGIEGAYPFEVGCRICPDCRSQAAGKRRGKEYRDGAGDMNCREALGAGRPLERVSTGVGDLGDLSDVRSLRQMVYFGMVWEAHSVDVAGAAKADDATVDVSLWAVSGDAPGMEEARAMLNKTYFHKWQ